MTLRYTERAKDDIELAFEWYEKQRRGLGFEFLDCIEKSLNNNSACQICTQNAIPISEDALLEDSHFPYFTQLKAKKLLFTLFLIAGRIRKNGPDTIKNCIPKALPNPPSHHTSRTPQTPPQKQSKYNCEWQPKIIKRQPKRRVTVLPPLPSLRANEMSEAISLQT